MKQFILAVISLCLLPVHYAAGQDQTEIQQLEEELHQLKQEYRLAIQRLEQRIAETEARQKTPVQPVATSQSSGQGFNPDISVILQGTAIDFSLDSEPETGGFLPGPETEFRPEGFSLRESELVFSANIDDKFAGWVTVGLENEEGEQDVLAVEEAYIETLDLPYGLGLKFGRFYSDIGYQNRQHSHAWDFVDAPLVYRSMLANTFGDDGLQLRWIAPTDLFFEMGLELLRGAGFPGGGKNRGDGINNATVFAHIGGDIDASRSYRIGASWLTADSDERESGEEDTPEAWFFSGESDLFILDFVYKWAPYGNPETNNLILQAEFFYREEYGDIMFEDGVTSVNSLYDGNQQGFYVQSVYQFMPRWRAGLRYGWLDSDNTLSNNPGSEFDILDYQGDSPQRLSAMVDYSPSEFSRLRLQYNRDESRPFGIVDNQWMLQYIMSIGAHPAHQF